MEAKLPPRRAVVTLLVVATAFASNHLSARIAFDHGASVSAAVTARATVTALVLLLLMRAKRVRFALPPGLRLPAVAAGVLIAAQSYCLYSAVARIPPGLALLVFQTSPMLYVLLSWALGKEPPRLSALPPMLLALVGLALALGLRTEHVAARWTEIGAGVSWAFASGACMSVVYVLNAYPLREMDGRLRTFVMTSITAVLLFAGGLAAHAQALPTSAAGWAGLAGLTLFYCAAIISLFVVLPRVPIASTAALNFEPIALLVLTWAFLGDTVTALQSAGACLTVGAIAWLGLSKR